MILCDIVFEKLFWVGLYLTGESYQEIFLQCFDEKESGYIFRGMPESHIRSLYFHTVPNQALALRNHFALMPYIYLMKKNCSPLQDAEFDQDVSPLISIVWL